MTPSKNKKPGLLYKLKNRRIFISELKDGSIMIQTKRLIKDSIADDDIKKSAIFIKTIPISKKATACLLDALLRIHAKIPITKQIESFKVFCK